MGLVSAAGSGKAETVASLQKGSPKLFGLTLFPSGPDGPLPVGEVLGVRPGGPPDARLPRTHQLARLAADQAMAGGALAPEAIVLGGTTGGMPATEVALEVGDRNPDAYAYHGVGSVAEDLARRYGCNGPVITLSTACASGATAIAVAMEMIRSGMVGRVLAGGADALCRLTYFGFKSLQLLDPDGARPLDRHRRGMSLGEGAAMLLLTNTASSGDELQLLGAGLSCDAYHPSSPHPRGAGAVAAMQTALKDAGLESGRIDYVNLHGTGTPDNDRAEAAALHTLFGNLLPPVSSTKGITGHTLAAAGALETIISALCIEHGFVPPNAGTKTPDPELNLSPVEAAAPMAVTTVLSNSFGFGGNNAALIIGRRPGRCDNRKPIPAQPLIVMGYACLSGRGRTRDTLSAMRSGVSCHGRLSDTIVCEGLSSRAVRRLKRLPKIAMALTRELRDGYPEQCSPQVISMGTGWGALSETNDFLSRLQETGYRFPSPMDFIGSVHNSPAGQIAMMVAAKGANLTATGGDYAFEQAFLSADLVTRRSSDPILVMGADEGHSRFSPLFDRSAATRPNALSDGGGALLLRRGEPSGGIHMALDCFFSHRHPEAVNLIIESLGGAEHVNRSFGAILAGIPAAHRPLAEDQLARLLAAGRFSGPVIDFRRLTGEFATATAIAAAAGVDSVTRNRIGDPKVGYQPVCLHGKGILLVGLGRFITAMRISPP
jgi:3-oxoacyl-(acyl-carrier-protein) synthase